MTPSPLSDETDSALERGIVRFEHGTSSSDMDLLAIEEPLEIQVRFAGDEEFRPVSVTMRTPGSDRELAAGFLFNEGIIRSRDDIQSSELWGPFVGERRYRNILRVVLATRPEQVRHLDRHFFTNSSCGICGKLSLSALFERALTPLPKDGPRIRVSVVPTLPSLLRTAQTAFDCTGGLHATGLFSTTGELVRLYEDVGRHNAMDKLAGALLFENELPASATVLGVSGRLSFELVQKAIAMGVPILCAVGAPSSLAVQVAEKAGLTVAGFVRDGRFNVYTHEWRVER